MAQRVLIRGGEVYDGSDAEPARVDLLVDDGRIQAIDDGLPDEGTEMIDAAGLLVTPGLIDLHAHVSDGIGIYAIDPAEAGLKTGVTTLLDTGSTGCVTYEAFHRYIIPQAAEDVFVLLNISQLGCQGNPAIEPFVGELTDIRHADVPSAVACIERFADRIIGTKARITANLAAHREENEWAGLRGAVEAAERTGILCMIHHKGSQISVADALATLRPGDIYTHVFHGDRTSGFDSQTGAPLDAMLEARQRGILFDVGHGVGSFSWNVAEPGCQQFDFWPDTISTDIHRLNLAGPVFDLPTTMSKLLHLGMPLAKIIAACTSRPADAMRVGDRFGRLAVGRWADITLLRRKSGKFPLVDAEGESRIATELLEPVMTFKAGKRFDCQSAPLSGVA